MYHIEWPIFIIAVVAEVIGTASGLGSSILFLPAAQYFESPTTVMALTGILHVFANTFRLILFWNRASFKPFLVMAAVFLISSGLGAWLSTGTDKHVYKIAMGVALILFVILRLVFVSHYIEFFKAFKNPLMGLAGFVSGWLGTGGTIRALALNGLNLSKNEFIFASSGIDLGGDALRTAIYLFNGYLDHEHIFYIPALGLGAWIGSQIGKKIVARVSQRHFEYFTLAMLAVMGLSLLTGL